MSDCGTLEQSTLETPDTILGSEWRQPCGPGAPCTTTQHYPCEANWQSQMYGLGLCINGYSEKPMNLKCSAGFRCSAGIEGDQCDKYGAPCYGSTCPLKGFCPGLPKPNVCPDKGQIYYKKCGKCLSWDKDDDRKQPYDIKNGPYYTDGTCTQTCNNLKVLGLTASDDVTLATV